MKTRLTFLIIFFGLGYNSSFSQLNVQEASYTGKPIIEMIINNKKTWVLLDTGSDITILNIGSKDEFGFKTFLDSNPKFKVPGLGSQSNQLEHASKVDMRFGNIQLRGKIFAFDINNIANSIEARTGNRITAIIGTSMMKAYGFVIDMGNNKVSMYYKDKESRKLAKNKSIYAGIKGSNHIK